VREVGAERLVEAVGRFTGGLGEYRPRVPQPDGDAGSRDVAGGGFDLFHACSRFAGPAGAQRCVGQVADERQATTG